MIERLVESHSWITPLAACAMANAVRLYATDLRFAQLEYPFDDLSWMRLPWIWGRANAVRHRGGCRCGACQFAVPTLDNLRGRLFLESFALALGRDIDVPDPLLRDARMADVVGWRVQHDTCLECWEATGDRSSRRVLPRRVKGDTTVIDKEAWSYIVQMQMSIGGGSFHGLPRRLRGHLLARLVALARAGRVEDQYFFFGLPAARDRTPLQRALRSHRAQLATAAARYVMGQHDYNDPDLTHIQQVRAALDLPDVRRLLAEEQTDFFHGGAQPRDLLPRPDRWTPADVAAAGGDMPRPPEQLPDRTSAGVDAFLAAHRNQALRTRVRLATAAQQRLRLLRAAADAELPEGAGGVGFDGDGDAESDADGDESGDGDASDEPGDGDDNDMLGADDRDAPDGGGDEHDPAIDLGRAWLHGADNPLASLGKGLPRALQSSGGHLIATSVPAIAPARYPGRRFVYIDGTVLAGLLRLPRAAVNEGLWPRFIRARRDQMDRASRLAPAAVTDGITIHVHYYDVNGRYRPPERAARVGLTTRYNTGSRLVEPPVVEGILRGAAQLQLEGQRGLGGDIGKINIVTIAEPLIDGGTKTYALTRGQYQEDIKWAQRTALAQQRTARFDAAWAGATRRTTDAADARRFRDVLATHGLGEVQEELMLPFWANDRFTALGLRTSSLETFFSGVRRGVPGSVCSPGRTPAESAVLVLGDADIAPTVGGVTAPTVAMTRAAISVFGLDRVRFVSEHRSSKTHASCGCAMQDVEAWVSRERWTRARVPGRGLGLGKARLLTPGMIIACRGLRRCPVCSQLVDRDVNAAINILHAWQVQLAAGALDLAAAAAGGTVQQVFGFEPLRVLPSMARGARPSEWQLGAFVAAEEEADPA